MRFRLRTLLIVLGVAPLVLATPYWFLRSDLARGVVVKREDGVLTVIRYKRDKWVKERWEWPKWQKRKPPQRRVEE